MRIMRLSAKLKLKMSSDYLCSYSLICRCSLAKRNAYNAYNGFNLIGATPPAFVKTSILSTLQYIGLGLEFGIIYILSNSVVS